MIATRRPRVWRNAIVVIGVIAVIGIAFLLNRSSPASESVEAGMDAPDQVQVFITVTGDEMEIVYLHESGERRTIPVEYGEWSYDYYAEVGDPVYVSARNHLATGTVRVIVRVEGEETSEHYQDHTVEPYGEVTMDRTIPSIR